MKRCQFTTLAVISNMQSRLLLPKARRTYQILIYGSLRFGAEATIVSLIHSRSEVFYLRKQTYLLQY